LLPFTDFEETEQSLDTRWLGKRRVETPVWTASSVSRLGCRPEQLTILATIFLPLTFVTGFSGQDFGWLTGLPGPQAVPDHPAGLCPGPVPGKVAEVGMAAGFVERGAPAGQAARSHVVHGTRGVRRIAVSTIYLTRGGSVVPPH
jgi:hypothetical protein